jgi:acyl dehydratase
MPLNPDAVGTESQPTQISWTSKDALLYAVSLGAGQDDLAYSTENTNGVEQQVLPTLPVVLGGGGGVMANIGSFNPALLVHGQQAVTLHRPLPVAGEATVVGKLVAIYDKGKAAVVVTENRATAADGEPLFTTRMSAFIRGEGGWGGDRGPSGAQNVPPERAPDHQVTYRTSPDQAFVYRLNGDRNPLHTDPSFAAMGGFDRPILHGLCTYGFTGRALLRTFCDDDSSRFQHIEGRFASPVLPGEELTISMWDLGGGEAVFTTSVGDRVVIDQGLHRHS